MTDKELADKVVALGVGWSGEPGSDAYWPDGERYATSGNVLRADTFVRDWRVAGALLERLDAFGSHKIRGNKYEFRPFIHGCRIGSNGLRHVVNESLPRAIIEACVEALDD